MRLLKDWYSRPSQDKPRYEKTNFARIPIIKNSGIRDKYDYQRDNSIIRRELAKKYGSPQSIKKNYLDYLSDNLNEQTSEKIKKLALLQLKNKSSRKQRIIAKFVLKNS